jgi:ferredoxin/flavodoxin---NADP+ reductase
MSARRFRVAVVGSGPAGFYAAEALLRSGREIGVDMFERLPVPYGLVRFGVAPDHQKLKQVTAVFERIAALPGFRFLGGVEVGATLSLEALRGAYDAVVLATGAALGRNLGVSGETLPGSHQASDFVAWYNGHPDHKDSAFDLSGERAVVVGHGNVALDVARLLMKTPDELRRTDIAAHALEALAESRIREVHVVGRGGPSQTRFAMKELQEFATLDACTPSVEGADVNTHGFSAPEGADLERQAAVALLRTFLEPQDGKPRRCVFRFHLQPTALLGAGRVERALFRSTTGAGDEEAAIDCGLFIASVGRRAAPLTGAPYDEARGVHANEGGRVVGAPGLYVCGWSKRGPSGTIGVNRACAVETVARLLSDLDELAGRPLADAEALIAAATRRSGLIDFAAWRRIDAAEVARGRGLGKPREKYVSVEELLAVAREEDIAC